MSLPDDDLEPLEPPATTIGIPMDAIALGREVIAMPCANPALSPTLDVIGFPGLGWNVRVKDAYGTLVFSLMLEGIADGPPA